MAHLAKISCLAEDLVTSCTRLTSKSNPREFKRARDHAVRGLRAQHYGRTNQFDVQATFEGLDEKFRVLNRDDLADALKLRFNELSKVSSKWTPEILSLFLELSDRPVEKTNVDDLELLKPPPSPPPLTWADIIAEDPLVEEGVWDDIDYAAESSGDERSYRSHDRTVSTDVTEPSVTDEEEVELNPEDFVTSVKDDALSGIQDAQFWKFKPPSNHPRPSPDVDVRTITELQAVRETLFMLAGLPTSLFIIDEVFGKISNGRNFRLGHAIQSTTHDLLDQLAELGSKLLSLRQWIRKKHSVLLYQTFQASVRRYLSEFDKSLASLQKRYLVPDHAVSVSLIEVHSDVRTKAAPVLRLAELITYADSARCPHLFLEFEMLFDEINLAQMTGEADVFETLARVFFDCLGTYLKPLRKWMENGELGLDDETFFVGISDKSSDAASLWHDQFTLRRSASGELHAPKFLQPAAKRIFNTGKSVVFLKELGKYNATTAPEISEPLLDFSTVCGAGPDLTLPPFSELFGSAFQNWIRSKYSLASTILRELLFSECGLWRTLDALEYVYFSKDGSMFQTFADALFLKIDRGRRGWNDRFILTELAQTIFSTVGAVQPKGLTVRTTAPKHKGRTLKTLPSVIMEYSMPWAIMNIIQRSSLAVYQRIFTLLLQVYRAKYLLQNFDLNDENNSADINLKHMSYNIRHKLVWFTDNLRSYLTETVIAESTAQLRKDLNNAEDIDAMADVHSKYITRLEAQCLLAKNLTPIHQSVVSLLDLAVIFYETKSLQRDGREAQADTKSKREKMRRRKSAILQLQEFNPDDSSSGEDDHIDQEENNYEADAEDAAPREQSSKEKLVKMQDQFNRSMHFITAGLRGVSRAGGESTWEMLAERLEWETSRNRP